MPIRAWVVCAALAAACRDPAMREEPDTVRQMVALDDATGAIRDAIVRGDLYDARRRAGALSGVLSPLPGGDPASEQALRVGLSDLRSSASIQHAAAALGEVVSTCATCHAAVGATVDRPRWPSVQPVADPESDTAPHARAADRLWLGVVGPSDAALQDALGVLPGDGGDAADQRVRDLASAIAAASPEHRGARYAELLVACAGCHRGERSPPRPRYDGVPLPNVSGDMQHHYFHALMLEMAVIGGDLERAHRAGAQLEAGRFADLPEGAAEIADVRAAAGRAARATSISEAASATADLAAACGRCHVATGGGPTDEIEPPAQAPHMALHLYGGYWMGYGLVAANEKAWTEGARVLATAPLAPEGVRLVEGADTVTHVLAARAAATTDWTARAAVWGELLAECAVCHTKLPR